MLDIHLKLLTFIVNVAQILEILAWRSNDICFSASIIFLIVYKLINVWKPLRSSPYCRRWSCPPPSTGQAASWHNNIIPRFSFLSKQRYDSANLLSTTELKIGSRMIYQSTLTYDSVKRITSSIADFGQSGRQSAIYNYDADSNVIKVWLYVCEIVSVLILLIEYVNSIPATQFSTGITRNNQSNSHMLSLTECVWEFRN